MYTHVLYNILGIDVKIASKQFYGREVKGQGQSYGPLFIFFVRAITSTVFDLGSRNFMDIYILTWQSVTYNKIRARCPLLTELWPFVYFLCPGYNFYNFWPGFTTLYRHIHPDMAECRVIKFGHAAHDLQSYGPLIIFFALAITSTVSDLGS